MRIAVFLVGLLIIYGVFVGVRFWGRVQISRALVAASVKYERAEGTKHLLVLGDSTAASVGSPPDVSVPGRLGRAIDAAVENNATSGAKTENLEGIFIGRHFQDRQSDSPCGTGGRAGSTYWP